MAVSVPSYLMKKRYSYYVRIRIPRDVRHRFCCRQEFRFSLWTSQVTKAKSKARLTAGLLQWVFRNVRQGGYLSVLNDEQIDKLIRKHIKSLLDEDLGFRLDYPQFQPKEEWHQNEIYGDMQECKGKTEHQLVSYDFSEVQKEAEAILLEAGENLPKDVSVLNKICQKLLQKKIGYWEIMAERAFGQHLLRPDVHQQAIDALCGSNSDLADLASRPLDSAVSIPLKTVSIGELAGRYWQERVEHLKPRSKQNYTTYQKRILEYFGKDTPVHTIDYYKAKDFRDFIKKSRTPELSVKKVNDYLDFLKGMFAFEMKTTRALSSNPADGLHLKDTRSKQDIKPIFELNDLELIFVRSKEYAKDTHRHASKFWLPLLGLYTGARLEELCQAKASDIKKHDGMWIFDIHEFDEKQSVKTGEVRKVPVHPFLLELGFHRYAQSLHDGDRLWPELKYVQSRWSHGISQWFTRFKNKSGIDATPRFKTFYSFRHTVATYLKDQEVPEVNTAELLGHKHGGITYGRYGKKWKPQQLLENTVIKLDWHERLDFSHLLKSKWASPNHTCK